MEAKPKNFYEKQVLDLLKQKYELLKLHKEKERKRQEAEAAQRKLDAQNAKKGILPLPPAINVPGLLLPAQIAGPIETEQADSAAKTGTGIPAAPPVEEEILPVGWQKIWSKSWKCFYYFNTKTEEKSWTFPIAEPTHAPPSDEPLEEMPEPPKEDLHYGSVASHTQGLTKAVFDAVTLILEKERLLEVSEMDTDMVDTLRQVPPGGALTAIAKFRKVDLTQVKDRRGLLRSMIHRQIKFRKDVTESNLNSRIVAPEVAECLDRLIKTGVVTEGQLEIRRALSELQPVDAIQILREVETSRTVKNPTGYIVGAARRYQQDSFLGKRKGMDSIY